MRSKGRLLQLDVLRAVAILLVIGRHLELPRPTGPIGVLAQLWYTFGWLGVELFFVLSGFLIGGLLISEHAKHSRVSISRFLVRRGLKIYPAYFCFVAYAALMPVAKSLLAGGRWSDVLLGQWALYWPNLVFLQNYVGVNPEGHTWTWAVEEHFYLALPLGVWALAVGRRMRILMPLCLLMAPVVVLILRFLSIAADDVFAVRMAATHLRIDSLLFGVGLRALSEYSPAIFAKGRDARGSCSLWVACYGRQM